MKNISTKLIAKGLLAIAAGAGLFTACQKSNLESIEPTRDGQERSIIAITEQSAATRTSLSVGDSYAEVHWSDGDQIAISSDIYNVYAIYTAEVDSTDKTRATFTGKYNYESVASAIYPADRKIAYNKISFPDTLDYAANNVAEGVMPMYAAVASIDSILRFKNLAGIVCLELLGSSTVKYITLSSTDLIAGEALVDYNNGAPLLSFTEAKNTVTLDCSNESGGGVQLNTTTATKFYITVPPTEAQSFTVTVKTKAGEEMTRTTTSGPNNQIKRGVITYMPELTFNPAYDFSYTTNTFTKTATITGLADGSTANAADLVIPNSIMLSNEAFTVTAIETNAFKDNALFTGKLILPETLLTIGDNAFSGCSGFIGNVTIPKGVTSIGESAFEGCTSFVAVSLFNGLKTIGTRAFKNCTGLNGNLILPEGLTVIGEETFANCSGLKGAITLPNTLTEIKNLAFSNCNFTSVSSNAIAAPVLSHSAFDNAGSTMWNLKLTIPAGAAASYNGTANWDKFSTFMTMNELKYIFKHGTNHAAVDGFADNTNIDPAANIVIPSTIVDSQGEEYIVVEINGRAFDDMTELTGAVVFPETLTTIGGYAFENCEGLTGTLTIPNSVTTIERHAFNNCSGLTGLKLSDNMLTIYDNTFAFCGGLRSLTLPENLKVIEQNAFYACENLTGTLKIPNNVTVIGEVAFAWTGITEIIFPETLTEIQRSAFSDCTKLTSLNLPKSLKIIGNSAFRECANITGTLTIPENVTTIGGYAFANCANISGTLTLPESVTVIDAYVFDGCTGLTGLTLSKNLSEIPAAAFRECENLSGTLVIPEGVTAIGNESFQNCGNLTGLTLPTTLKTIGESAFISCLKLSGELNVPEGVTDIAERAFVQCPGFSSLVLPSTVKNIGFVTFALCEFKSITCKATTPPTLDADVFSATPGYIGAQWDLTVAVPGSSISAYKADSEWSHFAGFSAL